MANTQTAKQLRELPEADLRSRADSLRQEMWQQRLKAKSGALQQVHRIGVLRRDIARIQTVIRQMQLANAREAKS
jgi:large subunit ribosomal protein L29